jgi:hypothetical protein
MNIIASYGQIDSWMNMLWSNNTTIFEKIIDNISNNNMSDLVAFVEIIYSINDTALLQKCIDMLDEQYINIRSGHAALMGSIWQQNIFSKFKDLIWLKKQYVPSLQEQKTLSSYHIIYRYIQDHPYHSQIHSQILGDITSSDNPQRTTPMHQNTKEQIAKILPIGYTQISNEDMFIGDVCNQLYIFYDDEDGTVSYQHMKDTFVWYTISQQADGTELWTKKDNNGKKIAMTIIPPWLHTINIQDIHIDEYQCIVHRWHSYHVDDTLDIILSVRNSRVVYTNDCFWLTSSS